MSRRALQKNIHARWGARILSRWFPIQACQELGSLLLAPDEQARSLAVDFFQTKASETGTTTIHVFCLGKFRAFVNGVAMDKLEWKTKKNRKPVYNSSGRPESTLQGTTN